MIRVFDLYKNLLKGPMTETKQKLIEHCKLDELFIRSCV